jgi:hypothetical protein
MKKLLTDFKNQTVLFFGISLLFTSGISAQTSLTNKALSAPSIFWLNFTSDRGVFNQMVVGYTLDATLGVDRGIDGLNINPTDYLCSTIEGSHYTIQGRPEFSIDDVVALTYNVTVEDNYSISIDHLNGLFESQDIFLRDKLLNIVHNLKSEAYVFASDAGTFANRFEIVYQNSLRTQQNTFTQDSVKVYKLNQELVIHSGTIKITDVQVYDLTGRLLVSKKNSNAAQITLDTGITPQALLVKITSATQGSIIKKIMN